MRTVRLYIDQPLAVDTEVTLPPDAARHATRVMRLRQGQQLTLFNGDHHDYSAHLVSASSDVARARIDARRRVHAEAPCPLVLVQCLAKGAKMDQIIKQTTELGVTHIVPAVSDRSEVRLSAERARKRLAHWRSVAVAACEQCGRACLPTIHEPQPLRTQVGQLPAAGTLCLALNANGGCRIGELALPDGGATLVVGPEGGFSDADQQALDDAGFTDLYFGPRTLRTETAGPAMLAALQACHEQI